MSTSPDADGAAAPRRHYARRESESRPSPVRAVFELALDPRCVSLAGGNPVTADLPHEEIAAIADRLLRERGAEVLQYGSGAGVHSLEPVIAALMARQGASVDARNLLITTGSQMGVDLATKLLCDPGDVLLAEGPTYVGAMGVFGTYEAELRQVPVDADGVDREAVEEALARAEREGRRVAYLYVIPHHQNPSGTTLTLERRRRLVEVCARRGVLIVEDDPYAFVGFPGNDPLPSLFSLNPDGVIHLGSFSKILSPGMRVGWMAAPPDVRDRLQIAGESVDIHPSVLSQEIVAAYVGTPSWREHLDALRAGYAQCCEVLLDALAEQGPDGVRWTRPSGGFFTWVTIDGVDPDTDLLAAAIEHDLVVVPGSSCFVQAPERAAVRLAYSNGSPGSLREGARRLAEVVRSLRGE
ncbi:PLP-dependent aminotransferase family protein [Actinomyces radicidentis]|uniref:aminotransferase-like domain-containing protein n=1 Tax=Actinomyces radicidentis TaxID=111015 RepID=UPI0026E0A711|nr:PLP-dependent aminotransferase family protein [Actinomyces radicidentis]